MKKQGAPWLSRSFTSGSARAMLRTASSSLCHMLTVAPDWESQITGQLLIRSDCMLSRIVAVLETSCDSWHLSIRACKNQRGQWADHHPLHNSECRLDHEVMGNRAHHVLGRDGERREAPGQYGAERDVGEAARQRGTAALSEYLFIDPAKDDRLDEHREKAEGNDDVLSVDRESLVVALEQDEMPNEAERKRRHKVRKNPKAKAFDHFHFPFARGRVAPGFLGGRVRTNSRASRSHACTARPVSAGGST